MIKGSVLKTFDETFDGATDNLLSRRRNNNPQESFGYDNLDRLVSVKSGAAETMKISYTPTATSSSRRGGQLLLRQECPSACCDGGGKH